MAEFPSTRLRQAGISAARVTAIQATYNTWRPDQQAAFRRSIASRTDEQLRHAYDPGVIPDAGTTTAQVVADPALLTAVQGAILTAHDTDAERETFTPSRLSDATLRAAFVAYYNVKSYGAKGDGVTDDSNAIIAAVAAAGAAGGGIVYAPAGRYRITKAVDWSSRVSLYGDGPGRTIFRPEGSGYSFITATTSALNTPIADCTFRDFEIDGSGYTLVAGVYDATKGKGIFIQYLLRCLFQNLHIHDCGATGLGVDYLVHSVIDSCVAIANGRLGTTSSAGASGIGIGTGAYSVESLVIANCNTHNNKRNGIFVEKNSGFDSLAIRIVGCYSGYNGDCGFGDAGAKFLVIDGCVAYNNARGLGLNLGTFTGPVPGREGLVTNSIFANSGTHGVHHAASTSTRGGYKLANCKITANNQAGIKVEIGTATIPNMTIADCEVYANKLDGVWVANVGGTAAFVRPKILRNQVWNNGATGTAGNQNGIRIDTPTTAPQINDNIVYDDQGTKTQAVGLAISGAVTGGRITGNDFRENTAATNITGVITGATTTGNDGWAG